MILIFEKNKYMDVLKTLLIAKGYTCIKLKLTKTNHFELKAIINGIKGRFILDTGASNSCVGFESVSVFDLKVKDSKIKAAGAGAINMKTQQSKKNSIRIGKWKQKKLTLVLFNLYHINTALTSHNSKPIDGIIGADILKKAKAIIDYNKKQLYLKL